MSEEHDDTAQIPTNKKSSAFSKCGCLRGDVYNGVVTLTTVNQACDHKMPDTDIPLAAASDVAYILAALGR